jgi:adenylyl-sulfate kinase
MLGTILLSRGVPAVVLDGDNLRSGLNRDLGFSVEDRVENLRRAAEVAKLLADEGHMVIAAFITPLDSLRRMVRGILEPGRYLEIYLDCPLVVCEARDTKGLYERAKKGEIPEFTGISFPFEIPAAPDLRVPTGEQTVDESVQYILGFLEKVFPDLRVSSPSGASFSSRRKRVFVLGLDCVPPAIAFGEIGRALPNLRRLMDHGVWGHLRSTDPPITLPAWTTITTGKDPGELGIYGFRNRLSHGYEEMVVVDSSHVRVPRVWDYLEDRGRSSILIGIPQTHPPRPHKGLTISDFHDPGLDSKFTFPNEIADEVHELAEGQYISDVRDFRTEQKDRLLKTLFSMVRRRFRVARDFVVHKKWDLFMMVEMATDRLHHSFWRYWAKDHPLHEPGNSFERVIPDFYQYLDACIGSLLALFGDDTTVVVVSDHGVCNMQGAVCINEWLIRNGYLTLLEHPASEMQISPTMIDWSRTLAWGAGGYYARIFFNVKGREPHGLIEPGEYMSVRDELAERLKAIPDEAGRPMATRVLKPEEIYRSRNDVPPDLIVYFDGLRRRSVGKVGQGRILQDANDTGPDDVNHDHDGIFIIARLSDLRTGLRRDRRAENASCLDITPTILHEFGLPIPEGLAGNVIGVDQSSPAAVPPQGTRSSVPAPSSTGESDTVKGYTPEEAEIVRKRLEDLGYI